jgi:hypothetical protein
LILIGVLLTLSAGKEQGAMFYCKTRLLGQTTVVTNFSLYATLISGLVAEI